MGLHDTEAEQLRHVLWHSRVTILPLENDEGRARVEAGETCRRTNGRGVDINRNYSVDWGVKEPDYAEEEEYPGMEAFSVCRHQTGSNSLSLSLSLSLS